MRKPIGVNSLTAYIHDICVTPAPYASGLLRPAPVFLYLPQGGGRTTLARYAAAQFEKARILPFVSRSHLLESTADGSLAQFRLIEDSLTCGAGYTNHFDGVAALGLDTVKLCESLQEACTDAFFDALVQASAHCFLLLFADSPTPASERVKHALTARLQNLVCLPYEPYTQAELAAILQARLQDKGAPCPGSKALTALVKEAHVTTLPQLDPLEKQLILSAYRSAPVPEKEERLHKNV